MRQDQAFVDVTDDLENTALQARIEIDRDKVRALGITAEQLRSTLYSGFGSRQISTIYTTGDNYPVIVEFDPRLPWTAERLDQIRIHAASGKLVPLSAFATVERTAGPLTINQLGQLPAVTVSFNLPDGVSLGDAVQRLEVIKTELGVPSTISTTFSGTARVFEDALGNQGLLLLAAVVTIYIVLGVLYESFIHPLTILTGLPAAAVGALAALELFGMDLSVIAIIGLLMLIGIVKKNAIMMIDVALVRQRAGAAATGCDPRGLPAALPADHDDDARRDHGRAADRHRPRRQRGAASAPGHRRGRRPAGLADPDAVHHAGPLHLYGGPRAPAAGVVPAPTAGPSRCRGDGGGMTARGLSRRGKREPRPDDAPRRRRA